MLISQAGGIEGVSANSLGTTACTTKNVGWPISTATAVSANMPKIEQEFAEQTAGPVVAWPHALQFILPPISRTWPVFADPVIIGGIATAASLSGIVNRAIIANMILRRRRRPVMVKD
jgi:hypothetical protein